MQYEGVRIPLEKEFRLRLIHYRLMRGFWAARLVAARVWRPEPSEEVGLQRCRAMGIPERGGGLGSSSLATALRSSTSSWVRSRDLFEESRDTSRDGASLERSSEPNEPGSERSGADDDFCNPDLWDGSEMTLISEPSRSSEGSLTMA